jgi:hypothetical protein
MASFLIRFYGPLAFAGCLFLGAVDAAHSTHEKELTSAECLEMMAGGLLGSTVECK